MKRHTIFHIPPLSFFSSDLYRDIAKNWTGLNFLYLLLLLAVCWIPVMVKIHLKLSAAIAREAPGILVQIPSVTVVEGEVSLDEPQPYTIQNPKTGDPMVIIDTTGEVASLDDAGGARVLITKDRVITRQSSTQTRAYDLSRVDYFYMDQERAEGWVEAFRAWVATLLYPFMVGGSFAYRILQALLYAAIGILFARMVNAVLDYTALVRLAVAAVSPVIILDTLKEIAGADIPAWWLLCFLIAMGYLYFAVRASAGNGAEAPVLPETPEV